jgi:hypothetical protein
MKAKAVKEAACSYSLYEPKQHARELYVKALKQPVLKKASLAKELVSASTNHCTAKIRSKKLANAVCNIAV